LGRRSNLDTSYAMLTTFLGRLAERTGGLTFTLGAYEDLGRSLPGLAAQSATSI